MKRSKFSEEQVSYALKLAEQGTPVKDVVANLAFHSIGEFGWGS